MENAGSAGFFLCAFSPGGYNGIVMKQNRKYNYILTAGHFGVDLPQGALSAILPYLINAYHFDYATAASLVLAANLVGSIVQPFFGSAADRKNQTATMIFGLALAGIGISFTGLISDFPLLCGSVILMGIGVSMYHPEAALLVNRLSETGHTGNSISIFSFGGNMGFGLGPLTATLAITAFGLHGTLVFLVLAAMLLVMMLYVYPVLKDAHFSGAGETEEKAGPIRGKNDPASFGRLCFVIFGRSIIYSGFNTFLALYWIEKFHEANAKGGMVLSAFFIIAAISTLAGGRIADHFGYVKTTRISCLILFPSILLLALAQSKALILLALVPSGFAISLCYSPTVVLGQSYLPKRQGLASGITLGLSVSVGGLTAPLMGKIGDAYSLQATFIVLALIAIVPLIMSFTLKEPEKS